MSDSKEGDRGFLDTVAPATVDQAKIAEGVGAASGSGPGRKTPLSKFIEAAMSAAIKHCYANGILDPEIQRATIQKARRLAKEFYEQATPEQIEAVMRGENMIGAPATRE